MGSNNHQEIDAGAKETLGFNGSSVDLVALFKSAKRATENGENLRPGDKYLQTVDLTAQSFRSNESFDFLLNPNAAVKVDQAAFLNPAQKSLPSFARVDGKPLFA